MSNQVPDKDDIRQAAAEALRHLLSMQAKENSA